MKSLIAAIALLSLLASAAHSQFRPNVPPGLTDQNHPGLPPDMNAPPPGPLQPQPTLPPENTLCVTPIGACRIDAVAPPGLDCWCQSSNGAVPGTTQ